MSLSSNSNHLGPAIARADQWLHEQGRVALQALNKQNEDTLLRSIKARTELLFWNQYVSPEHQSPQLVSLIASFKHNEIGSLLSIFRHNPELSSLFLCYFFSISDVLNIDEINDAKVVASYLASYPRERTLFRTLDHCHASCLFHGGTWPTPHAEALLGEGCLPLDGKVFSNNREIFYAISHTIFYATDFGNDSTLLKEASRSALVEYLTYLMDLTKSDNDIDILSEFALCLMFMNSFPEERSDIIDYLLRNQHEDGYWPCTEEVISAVGSDGIPPQQIAFFSHYHTTLLVRDVLARSTRKPPRHRERLTATPFIQTCPDPHDYKFNSNLSVEAQHRAYGHPRLANLLLSLQSAIDNDKSENTNNIDDFTIMNFIAKNDVASLALAIPRTAPSRVVKELVRFFHESNESKVLGYGFPNPNSQFYDVDRVALALAGLLIETKIARW